MFRYLPKMAAVVRGEMGEMRLRFGLMCSLFQSLVMSERVGVVTASMRMSATVSGEIVGATASTRMLPADGEEDMTVGFL
jgi:hypothetical protein